MVDKGVVVVVGGGGGDDVIGEGMQCVDHPHRGNPGGVCAFCLQEKLRKLVSSSKSSPFFPFQPPPSSSSASPTSFGSDAGVGGAGGLGLALAPCNSRTGAAPGGRRTKFPFLPASHSKKKKSGGGGEYGDGGRRVMASVSTTTGVSDASASAANDSGIVLRRSKSVATRMAGGLAQGGGIGDSMVADSPRKKSFWSFLYLSSSSSTSTSSSSAANYGSSTSNINRRRSTSSSSGGGGDRDVTKQQPQQRACGLDKVVGKEEAATAAPRQGESGGKEAESPSGSQASSSFGRKVSRSRSVGCGSRSFSGDFLERISTGFGDCTLRRVESQREAKPKSKIVLHLDHDNDDGEGRGPRTKERAKCGGLFGGFGMMSSAYWLSATAANDDFDGSSRISAASASVAVRGGATPHGRTRSWGWAFASPMRAFRPYSSSKSLYAINNSASAAPVNNGGGRKGNKLDGNPSNVTLES